MNLIDTDQLAIDHRPKLHTFVEKKKRFKIKVIRQKIGVRKVEMLEIYSSWCFIVMNGSFDLFGKYKNIFEKENIIIPSIPNILNKFTLYFYISENIWFLNYLDISLNNF